MSDSRQSYLDQTFGGETALLRELAKHSEAEGVQRMQVSPFEGRLLRFLVSLTGAKRIVEIGSLFGYSATWMASCWDYQCEIHCFEKEASRAERSLQTYQDNQILCPLIWHIGPAQQRLSEIEGQNAFDLCFIDADKGSYPLYLDWAERNIKNGGLIIGDNSFLWGHVHDENPPPPQDGHQRRVTPQQVAAMREFNQRLSDRQRYESTLLPTAEGLTVARKLF